MTPREHIEKIRREKFYIGADTSNPLSEDLHHAVRNLSAELYAKDVHFLMELIQNAEDNEYPSGLQPSLEFVITSWDITATGASATLLIFNNEKGFSEKNIDSICSVGKSTKKGKRQQGYIGEKGIGFKSVFLITTQPFIFSNGYQIGFNEDPLPDYDVPGYIVPEWVNEKPTLSDIKHVYGADKILPTTTIVLPLKSEKVAAVKQQLSTIHPEVLLFLSKIRQLSVREHTEDPGCNTISAISITSERNYEERKNINAVSSTLHLSATINTDGEKEECVYYMWRQKFPVKLENQIIRRDEIEEWVITLALPYGDHTKRGIGAPGVYAYLPTEMITNFPFIIQADFVLASSRETILLDNKWNKGILDCVPSAFVEAFTTLLAGVGTAPLSSLLEVFESLPVEKSSYPELNKVREEIKEKLVAKNILPAETCTDQRFFYKPEEVGRLVPAFWNVLTKAQMQGISLHNLSSHGTYILSSMFDNDTYDHILDFLGVGYVDADWYVMCIRNSNLPMGVSEDVYLELLCFFAENWGSYFRNTDFDTLPILKYVGLDNRVSLWSITRATGHNERICLSSDPEYISWLIDWNKEFGCITERLFMPVKTQEVLNDFPKRKIVKDWLKEIGKVHGISLWNFCCLILNEIENHRGLVVAFTHFLYHSHSRGYLSDKEVCELSKSMPIISSSRDLITRREVLLVPAKGSKWVGLLGSNPWIRERYIELGEDYLGCANFANTYTSKNQIMGFLRNYTQVKDLPDFCPPNASFTSVFSPLNLGNAFLLLDWIHNLRANGFYIPEKFLMCIKTGGWLKTSVGYRPPSESFLCDTTWGVVLQSGCELVDIPLIDEGFYGNRINGYKEELKAVGVMSEFGEACRFIGKHLMSFAASSLLTRSIVLYMLKFIRYLREKYLSPEEFIKSVKESTWLKTSVGYRSPVGSVLFGSEWHAASRISRLPLIDDTYYGNEILSYKEELQLLGVVVKFDLQIVAAKFALPSSLTSLGADSILLILKCIQNSQASNQIVSVLKSQKWVKTNHGYRLPSESFLFDYKWGTLLKVFDNIALIDEKFYQDSIRTYKEELKKTGVVVSFAEASKAVARSFRQHLSSGSLRKENVLSLLSFCKHLKETGHQVPSDLSTCLQDEKWVQTLLGYRCPKDSILFNAEWESISAIASLPFIDDSETCYGKVIHDYKDMLKELGVVVQFREGSRFVAAGLKIPQIADSVTPMNVFALLQCVRHLQEKDGTPVKELKDLKERACTRWIRTHMGYKFPGECILFNSDWGTHLHREDGPFIDEVFYGTKILSYKNELEAVGVITDCKSGSSLIASYLNYHFHTDVITRIYTYLSRVNWEPENKGTGWIWIPNGEDGEWVQPAECVLHDTDNLFGSQLNVLEKHYEKELLSFFFMALGVKPRPSIHDYRELWTNWEVEDRLLTDLECCSFWSFIAKNWNRKTEKLLSGDFSRVPVYMDTDAVKLFDKYDVFIPDDLLLKDLFEKGCANPMFVWHPQSTIPSLSRSKLFEIYGSIGVRTISEAAQKVESSIPDEIEFKLVKPSEFLHKKGIFRIILSFLSDSSRGISIEKKHQIAKRLCDVQVYESEEPITVSYVLPMSSGKSATAKASKVVRWERENSKLFIQKIDKQSGVKAKIELATRFSQVVSEGLLWDTPDWIIGLAELTKLGYLLDFDEEAVSFLLKSKNMDVPLEDEEFISSALSCN
ncbi:hypothetical protein H6P81_012415 [Aristolochia fimbriata]|uniref:Sacsin/Nov domain-containing protein n=1 Tax=Aristolochia fimbriata TaxID=158543 RepID=A0AAV7EBR0_ARIFI|nr:hypothetical protein H6P81_012415 [Aristolochia fimbriata]